MRLNVIVSMLNSLPVSSSVYLLRALEGIHIHGKAMLTVPMSTRDNRITTRAVFILSTETTCWTPAMLTKSWPMSRIISQDAHGATESDCRILHDCKSKSLVVMTHDLNDIGCNQESPIYERDNVWKHYQCSRLHHRQTRDTSALALQSSFLMHTTGRHIVSASEGAWLVGGSRCIRPRIVSINGCAIVLDTSTL